MNTHTVLAHRLAGALVAMAALLTSAPAAAADAASPSTAAARYRQDQAACAGNRATQDRSTCLREAGAAFAEAKRGTLDKSGIDYARNQRLRCDRLPDSDRVACLARMDGEGTISGSVAGGGLYRELVTREATPPVTVGPAGAAPAPTSK